MVVVKVDLMVDLKAVLKVQKSVVQMVVLLAGH